MFAGLYFSVMAGLIMMELKEMTPYTNVHSNCSRLLTSGDNANMRHLNVGWRRNELSQFDFISIDSVTQATASSTD